MSITMQAVWPQGKYDEKNFHCLFLLKKQLAKKDLFLHLSAEDHYRVHINGSFAGVGPSRCAHGMAHIDRFVLPIAKDGRSETVIAVEVAGYNIAAITDAADKPFFAARITDGEGELYAESADFCAYALDDIEQRVPRYSWQRYFLECYRMKHDRTRLYRGEVDGLLPLACEAVECPVLAPRNVPYPDYRTVEGMQIEAGRMVPDPSIPPYTNRFLDARVGENGFMREEIEHHLVDAVHSFTYRKGACKRGEASYRLYDLGANRSGFFGLQMSAAASSEVVLVWDELLDRNGHIEPLRTNMANMLRVELGAGTYSVESLQPYTARYVAAVVTRGEVQIDALYMRTFENPHAARLRFTVSNSDYAALLEAARATFAQNAVDILTDCPSRERVGWLCDSYFIGAAEQLFCGECPVERHFLENYACAPQADYIPTGMIPMSYPGYSNSKNYICNWALWYILELRAYLERTGDRGLIERSRGKVTGVLACLANYENEYGLLEDVPGWNFVEWSRANEFVGGVNFPSNMLYTAALEAADALYAVPNYRARAEKLRAEVPKWAMANGLFFCDHAVRADGRLETVKTDISETCQYYAFYFGFADAARNGELLDLLLTEFGCDRDERTTYPQIAKSNAFIGNLLRLAFLSENGYAGEALRQTAAYHLHMARRTGTLWEYADEYKSCNHGFASYIAGILLRGLIGYDGKSGNTVRFLPELAGVDCHFEIPLNADEYMTVTVQNGVRTVTVPKGFTVQLMENE